MREYHLKPWELQLCTPTELAWMTDALRQDGDQGDDGTHREGEDATAFDARVRSMVEEAARFRQLPADQQLRERVEDLLRQYGRGD